MTKHYVGFLLLGGFFNDTSSKEIPDRNYSSVKPNMPNNAIAFWYFDKEVIIVDGEELIGKDKNISPKIWFGNEFTALQVYENFPNLNTLISNIKSNNYTRLVKTIFNTWQPLEKEDVVWNNK